MRTASGSRRLLLAGLLADDVAGLPVRPLGVVLTAVPLLVLTMGGRGAAQRGGEIGLRRERGGGSVDAAGQPRGDFLQQPAVAVGIVERSIGAIGGVLGMRAAQAIASKQIGLVVADVHI